MLYLCYIMSMYDFLQSYGRRRTLTQCIKQASSLGILNSNVRTRVRAIFLAAIMLVSVVAMSGAFVGGVAAQNPTITIDSGDSITISGDRLEEAGAIDDQTAVGDLNTDFHSGSGFVTDGLTIDLGEDSVQPGFNAEDAEFYPYFSIEFEEPIDSNDGPSDISSAQIIYQGDGDTVSSTQDYGENFDPDADWQLYFYDNEGNLAMYPSEPDTFTAKNIGLIFNAGIAKFVEKNNNGASVKSTDLGLYAVNEQTVDSVTISDQTIDLDAVGQDQTSVEIEDDYYTSIQSAINNAESGDTIKIGDGTYSGFDVTESVTVTAASGANPVIEDSDAGQGIITVQEGSGNGITISDLTIRDSDTSSNDDTGVFIETQGTDETVTVESNKIEDIETGIQTSSQGSDGPSIVEIKSNNFNNKIGTGISIQGKRSAEIDSNTFDETTTGVGIAVAGDTDVNSIQNNDIQFDDVNEAPQAGIQFLSGASISKVTDNTVTGLSEIPGVPDIEVKDGVDSINGETGQSGQLQYVIDNNDITTTNPVTVSDVQLTNPSQKQLDLSVTTTGDLETGTSGDLEVSFTAGTNDGDNTLKTGDSDFSEQDNGDGTYTYTASVDADVSSGESKSYQATVDKVDENAGSLPSSGSIDVSVASIGTDGSTTINTGSTTVSSANIQSNADTSSGTVTTSVSNDVPSTGSQSQQNLEEDVSSVDENAQVVSAVNINPSDSTVESSSATLEFTLSRSNVGEPSNIRVVRFNDNTNSYESLPTSVVDTTSSEVTVQAQTTGFSLFAIVETAEPATVSPEPIESDPLNITAESDTVAVGENVTLTVTNDATVEPVADAAVELPSQTVRTNANGSVTVSFNTTGELTLTTTGNIDASYSPDSLTLTVTEADTPSGSLIPLNFTADSESVVVGEELTLSVTNADTDEPVANLPIALPNQTIQTNANGSVTVTFNSTGNVTVETVGASDTYESNTLTITVTEANAPNGSLIPLTLTADSESIVVGEEITLSVTNADTGEPVANLPIALPNQTVETDTTGNTTVVFNSTGNVTVETAGASDIYESNTLTITVEEAGEIPEDAVYDPDSVAAEFDDDADGQISITELGAAGWFEIHQRRAYDQ